MGRVFRHLLEPAMPVEKRIGQINGSEEQQRLRSDE